MTPNFFNINRDTDGIARELAPGITATIHTGDQAMVSVVRVAPGTRGTVHDHPEEQWGYCISGSGVRHQDGRDTPIDAGDFWRTPGGVPHTVEAGPEGLTILDVFAPPRAAYTKPGKGFASD